MTIDERPALSPPLPVPDVVHPRLNRSAEPAVSSDPSASLDSVPVDRNMTLLGNGGAINRLDEVEAEVLFAKPSKKSMTSEEQKAALGNVRHKLRQGDLFTGQFDVRPPKKGDGRHIPLTRKEGEPAKAIGMAHFPGTGPERTYCRECKHYQDIDVYRGGRFRKPRHSSGADNVLPIRTKRDACMKAAQLFDGIVQRGGIGSNRSCKYFIPKDGGPDALG